jgi:hypothetical protein
MFESIQANGGSLNWIDSTYLESCAMHPVNFLFEDIYRNDWSISSNTTTQKRRGKASPWVRELRFLVERKRS